MKVCVVGSGSWGNAIANILKYNKIDTTLLSRNNLHTIKSNTFDILFIALRTEAIEGFLQNYRNFLPKKICSISKGVFNQEIPFLSEKMTKEDFIFAILSGPNFADEVESKKQTITTIASKDSKFALQLKEMLETEYFSIELTSSVKSVESFGIFKNIIAIYAGFMEKRNFSANTKSMIFTLLIKEMVDFISKLEKSPESFFLSAGIGDIFLTSTNLKSRNFEYGYNFNFSDVTKVSETVEGLRSLSAISSLEKIYHFQFNLYKNIYRIIFEKKDIPLF